jgi:hypothetical protein
MACFLNTILPADTYQQFTPLIQTVILVDLHIKQI